MAHAYKLCGESDTIVSMPVGTVFQFGADEIYYGATDTWLPPETSTATYPKLPFLVYYTDWPTNPTPETKALDVQQTGVAQTLMAQFYGQGAAQQVIVPALVVVPPPVTTPPEKTGTVLEVPAWTGKPQTCWQQTVRLTT